MKTRKLITTKPHKYGTRHMVAGDEYEVPARHAVALVAGKKAKFAPDKPTRRTVEPMRQPEPGEPATTEAALDHLRLQATQLGIDIDGRWGVARLQHEIAQAKR